MRIRVASFFSGIGGFDLGFEQAGMKVVFQCEKNPFAKRILQNHWPEISFHDDISNLDASNIPYSDLWCAGFPCQDLSLANQGKRKGLKGDRSGLFFKFASLIEQRRPQWVVMENVPGLLNSHEGEDFRTLLKKMGEFGYCVAWRVLDAKFFGTPQRRRRVFIVASYLNTSAAEILFGNFPTSIAAKKSFSQEQKYSSTLRNSNQESNLYSIQHASIGRAHQAGPQAKGYRSDGETWTLDSRGAPDALCSANDAFRMRETSGLSGELDSTERYSRYKALGNAVAVPVVRWLGERIIEYDRQNFNSRFLLPILHPNTLVSKSEILLAEINN